MSEWQPIETAPCDGTAIWLLFEGKPFIGYGESAEPPLWPEDRWFGKTYVERKSGTLRNDQIYGTLVRGKPTHWMPLPEPPESK